MLSQQNRGMSFVILDNTKDLTNAKMTPLLIDYFESRNLHAIIISENEELDTLESVDVLGIILSGGPILLSEKSELFTYSKNFRVLLEYPRTPILGICFGFQLMGVAYGGHIQHLGHRARDKVMETISQYEPGGSLLYDSFVGPLEVFQCHQDHLVKCPPGFRVTSRNADNIIQSIECIEKLRFGVQFHPENSPDGHRLLNNFINTCMDRVSHS